jgi:alpha-ketoglutarate-dependent taurine dioxygenase
LKIHTLPDDVGGDTLWASGYEVYDRLSPTWQKIADGLTATHYNVKLLRSLQYLDKD